MEAIKNKNHQFKFFGELHEYTNAKIMGCPSRSGYWPEKEEVIHQDILHLPSITPNTHAYMHTFLTSTDPTWCETGEIGFSPLMPTQKQEKINIYTQFSIFEYLYKAFEINYK